MAPTVTDKLRSGFAAAAAAANAPRDVSQWLSGFKAAGPSLTREEVLAEEHYAIGVRRRAARLPGVAILPADHDHPPTGPVPEGMEGGKQPNDPTPLAGLALSGGGIRSATFCLGVLQALRQRGVLRMFDYLSTVSGGGFAGGWWSAWLSRTGIGWQTFPLREGIEWEREQAYRTGTAPDINRGAEADVELVDPQANIHDPIHHVRLFSNYLTPRKGLLSVDTWRAAAVLSRNLLLTWLILLPVLIGLFALTQIYFLTTPAGAVGFVCPSLPTTPTGPACREVYARLQRLAATQPDSVQAVIGHPERVLAERVNFALRPVKLLLGLLAVTTLIWLMATARDVPQLAGVLVGLGAALTLAHAVAERFADPSRSAPRFHSGHELWVTALVWGAVAILVLGWAVPILRDRAFLAGQGNDEHRDVRTNLVTRIHAALLQLLVIVVAVLAIGGFAPDLYDFVSRELKKEGAVGQVVAKAGGWLAVLVSLAGTGVTLWSAAPTGGGEGHRREPGRVRRVLLQVTPLLVLIMMAVLIAALLRYGLSQLPYPGPAARTPFFAIVPLVLLFTWIATEVAAWLPKGADAETQSGLFRTSVGLVAALGGAVAAFGVYWLARPLSALEPLGTSVLVAVLLCGFFTLFEYFTDESRTALHRRVLIVGLAGIVAVVAGVLVYQGPGLPLERIGADGLIERRTRLAMFVGGVIGLVLARASIGWTRQGDQIVIASRIPWLRRGWLRRPSWVLSIILAMALGLVAGRWLAHSPIPFDAVAAPVTEAGMRFAAFCFAALCFSSAFILADLCLSRSDSWRALWLQVVVVVLLSPTLMQQFLDPLAPSVLFVNTNLAIAGIAIAMAVGLGWLVDPNVIALHTFYRARLVRAYLGASNSSRSGNASGAFKGDDVRLSRVASVENGGPFHLINTTLNLVGGRDLITAQRSSASFTLSSLHCGSLRTGYRRTRRYMDDRMTLGTALAISGAAASPNMGSKTPSAAVTMLLAFLNVRLGFWAPTPSRSRWHAPQARLWPFYLLRECLSQTNDLGTYCYLTDGGHFDNTGLYALVERGCRYIMVIDCGADPDPSFGDIGDAVRRCRVDFGAEITLDVTRFRRDENGQAASHYVVGSIVFSEPHARSLRWGEALAPAQRSGIIVWVKPSRRPNDPADVIQYGLDNAVFPQQSTGDQWYTEAQFESYRRLGFRSAEDALEGVPAFGDQARVDAWQVFARIEANFAPPAAQANAPAGPMRP